MKAAIEPILEQTWLGYNGNQVSAWERYAKRDDAPERLVQLAVLHAGFEALHPFLDGNGRMALRRAIHS